MYLAIRIRVRNDELERKRTFVDRFETRREAIEHLLKLIATCDNYFDTDKTHEVNDARDKLEKDEAVWIIEWERRGSGDGYFVRFFDEQFFNSNHVEFDDEWRW